MTNHQLNVDEADRLQQYKSIVSRYSQLTIEEIANDSFSNNSLLFLGRASCPFCRDFLPKLQENIEKLNIHPTIYYYDVENITEEEKTILLSKFPIAGVPTLIYRTDEGSYIIFDDTKMTLTDWIASVVH